MAEAKQQPDLVPVRLDGRDCLVVGAVFVALVAFGPALWRLGERFEPGENYRIASSLRDDYFLFDRWAREAVARYPAVVVGDSTVWGRYCDRHSTWSAQLNRLAGRPLFANLGIDGLHNVALVGLLRDFGGAVRNTHVLLQLNPLWMTSEEHDLSQEKRADSINHPRLLPQFDPTLRCYRAPLEERLGIWTEHHLGIVRLVNHVSLAYYQSHGLTQWMTKHPYRCPVAAVTMEIDTRPEQDGEEPDTKSDWAARSMRPQNWPWMDLQRSRQWAAFREELRLLKARGNRVFVVVGPFNPHMLKPPSLARYRKLQAAVRAWLDAHHPDYHIAPELPSAEYGDSSHPLAAGYRRAARALFEDPRFRKYLAPLMKGKKQ